MKHQALFSSKDEIKKKKKIKVSSAAILLGSFKVKFCRYNTLSYAFCLHFKG